MPTFPPVSPDPVPVDLLIDFFSGFNVSQEKINVSDPLTDVLVIAVPVSVAEMETCQVSFSTKRVKQPISQRFWRSKPALHLLKSDLGVWTRIRSRHKQASWDNNCVGQQLCGPTPLYGPTPS